MTNPDQEALNDQLEGLRAKVAEGWKVNRLEKAPTHVRAVDDVANRFAWYEILEPHGDNFVSVGYVHFPKDVVL